jgi:DNA repair exonuclease SbcCD ATPase subunit
MRSQLDSIQDKDTFAVQNFEEMGEVSLQLAMIRKKYDIIKQENFHKRQSLDRLTKDLSTLDLLTNVHSDDHSVVEQNFNLLTSELSLHRAKLEEEIANEKTYKHIYNRINEDKIALELKSNQLHKQLKFSSQVLEAEKSKYRKHFEAIHSSRVNLKELKAMVGFENRQKMERIASLEKAMMLRKEAAGRREERLKKLAEIADIAANENTESQEISIKQSLLLHKIWYSYLKHKLDKKLKGAIEIEDAYQSIRSATGLQNIAEIVSNFVGKEENQAQLRNNIEEANKALDELKRRNEKSKLELKELMLIEGNNNTVEFIRSIRSVDEEIAAEKKVSEFYKDENKRYQDCYDEITVWSKKVHKSMGFVGNDDPKSVLAMLKSEHSDKIEERKREREEMLKEIKEIEKANTDSLVKSIYSENYSIIAGKFKKVDEEKGSTSDHPLDDDKKRKDRKGKAANFTIRVQ